MKRKTAALLLVSLLAFAATGCNEQRDITMNVPAAQVVEAGTPVRFAPLSEKAENVSEYKITVTAPNGKSTVHSGDSFVPDRAGSYTVCYEAFDGGSLVAKKNTLLTVLPAVAPVITVKQNTENIVWAYGGTYDLPSVTVWDNLDTDLCYEIAVTDPAQREEAITDGKITVLSGGSYTVTYSATDNGGNKGQTSVNIYATEADEIARFEAAQLANKFSSEGNCKLSYNTNEAYTYAHSKGSLKASFQTAEANTYPGVILQGSKLPHSNLYQSDFDGLRFKVYLTGELTSVAMQEVWVSFFRADGLQARVKLNSVEDYGLNRWLEFSMDKETLKNLSSFGESEISYLKIWTVLAGEEESLDMYLDEVEYFNYQ